MRQEKNKKISSRMFDVQPVFRTDGVDRGDVPKAERIVSLKGAMMKDRRETLRECILEKQRQEYLKKKQDYLRKRAQIQAIIIEKTRQRGTGKTEQSHHQSRVENRKKKQDELDEEQQKKEWLMQEAMLEDESELSKELKPRFNDRLDHQNVYMETQAEDSFTSQEMPEKTKMQTDSFWSSFFSNYKKSKYFDGNSFVAIGKPALSFATVAIGVILLIGAVKYISYGIQVKNNIQVLGEQAIGHLEQAKIELEQKNFDLANASFDDALNSFSNAQSHVETLGWGMLDMFSDLPFLSRVSSGKNVVYAGNELTKSAKELSVIVETFSDMGNPLNKEDQESISLTNVFLKMNTHVEKAKENLENAEKYIEKVKIEDLPVEFQEKFRKIKNALPSALSLIDSFERHSAIFLELLGHNGPRKYFLVFQNNQEMRATGGFIGSYGLLNISDGHVKKMFIDGIFNPDGWFMEDIIPPRPLQKITAGWSTHDANWFPHFPTTAKKIASFYEKTGGPTVDGIMTMTPTVMEEMLKVTGPIEMEEYDTVVNSENFIREIQYEVEVDYDKQENKPKKFLADLAPEILGRIFNVSDPQKISKVIAVFLNALEQKHILFYSFDDDVQKIISEQGWSGEILQTKKDYLMVINSNINGFKTDGIVDETISHKSEIMQDGSIVDTVKIKRTHNGGNSGYEWWNKVNSDFVRVYVPAGSELLHVDGQTREITEPPINYEKLGFKKDPDVAKEEENMIIDEESGTRIYREEGKTVFGNWIYVSPQETVELEYSYRLPFKIDSNKNSEHMDTYSILFQKQSGSIGSTLKSEIHFGDDKEIIWKYPNDLGADNEKTLLRTKLDSDKFIGIVLQQRQ